MRREIARSKQREASLCRRSFCINYSCHIGSISVLLSFMRIAPIELASQRHREQRNPCVQSRDCMSRHKLESSLWQTKWKQNKLHWSFFVCANSSFFWKEAFYYKNSRHNWNFTILYKYFQFLQYSNLPYFLAFCQFEFLKLDHFSP